MGYKIDSITDNCYEGTTCLVNKLNIRDENQLNELESHITLAKISMLQKNPIKGNFDFEHYKQIHQYLFEDLYEWAGKVRLINISKKGTSFVDADDIERVAAACFSRLKEENYFRNLDKNDFIDEITDFYIVTNNLHPFREGNGRTQRVFLTQLAMEAGYELDFSIADTDELMIATIHSANGVVDYLKNIIKKIVFPIV